jgi:beta-lactamase regulating signal transducer with metallopeptidase domain
MTTEILRAADWLVTAALNGAAQGAVLVLFVRVSLRLLGQTNAATRYFVWRITLVLLILLLPANLFLVSRRVGPAEEVRIYSEDLPGPAFSMVNDSVVPELPNLDVSDPSPDQASTNEGKFQFRVPNWLLRPFWNPAVVPAIPARTSAALLAAWIVVASVRLGFLLQGVLQLRALKAGATAVNHSVQEVFDRMRAKLEVRRPVTLAISSTQKSPVLVGFRRPMIVLPSVDLATEGILAHELAHVRRYDDWANLQQYAIQALLFFHPGVWWVSKQLTLEREIACDDYALQQGAPARTYALLLIEAARLWHEPKLLLAPGASNNHCQLQQRIHMILKTNRNTSSHLALVRVGIITSAAGLIGLVAVSLGPRLALAQNAAPAVANVATGETEAVQAVAPANILTVTEVAPTPAPDVEPGPKIKVADPDAAPQDSGPRGDRAPRAPRRPRAAEAADHNASIEDRLDRLERMVKSLVAEQKSKRAHAGDELAPDVQVKVQNEKRAAKQAQEDVARATEQARRAAKQASNAYRNEFRYEGDLAEPRVWEKSLQTQIKVLEKQRDVLQREMEKLQHEIERIQQQRERMDEKGQRHSDQKEQQLKDGDTRPDKSGE